MSFEYLSNRIASYADFQSACAIARAESVADLNHASRVLRSVWRGRLTLHLHCTIGLLRARLRLLGGSVSRRIPPSFRNRSNLKSNHGRSFTCHALRAQDI